MKFVFDWDADEDTSRDLNPLYQNLHGASLALERVIGKQQLTALALSEMTRQVCS